MGYYLAGFPEKSVREFTRLTRFSIVTAVNKVKLGFIVNPVAGIGGRVGLKGSDGSDIRLKALALGAVPRAGVRAAQALRKLEPLKDSILVLTYPGEMGENIAASIGFDVKVLGAIEQGNTRATDTINAARIMLELDCDLILFAGGDGTARDIYNTVGQMVPVLGIPAGVKIHSAAFARNPSSAGEIAHQFLTSSQPSIRDAEVMDIDEALYREGTLSSCLYGYLRVPFIKRYLQGVKTAISPGEITALVDIASEVVISMKPDLLYLLAPGTTTRAVTTMLALEKTLLGVDVIKNRELLLSDANESQLLELLETQDGKIIVTPIGGQGFLFGRGNQQLSPHVIRKIGTNNIRIISIPEKIFALQGQPLLVDTGDTSLDEELSGFKRVITGSGESIVYRVST